MLRWLSLDPAGLMWGSERALLDFIAGVPDTAAACCCPTGPLASRLRELSVPVYPSLQADLHIKGRRQRFIALLGLISALVRFRPRVLHVNQAGATRLALFASRLLRVPCIVHLRLKEDIDYLENLKPSPKHLVHLITISEPIDRLVAGRPALNRLRRTLLLDAYVRRRKSERAVGSEETQVQWDFVCVGRFAPSKGQQLLLEALTLLRERGVRFRAVFVGELNEYGCDLKRSVEKSDLADTVEFVGHSDDVHTLLMKSRWLICPSSYEPLGRVLFEAWDAARPVITGSFAGGAGTSVSSSGGGLLFSEWTAKSLAGVLEEALGLGREEEQAFAAKGYEWMRKVTDPIAYATHFREILRAAVE